MDAYGKVALIVIICIVAAVAFVLRYIANHCNKWTVLIVCIVIYALSYTFSPGHSRELAGLNGIMRMVGVIGGIYGISILRKKKDDDAKPDATG